MKYLLDTHTIYWYFENQHKLSPSVVRIILDEDNEFIIPSIVLAELKYICKKYKIMNIFKKIFDELTNDKRCLIIPLDEKIVDKMPVEFEMHDGIIVATAKEFESVEKEQVVIITKDLEIKSSGLVKTAW